LVTRNGLPVRASSRKVKLVLVTGDMRKSTAAVPTTP
jgi:hypothetical protein